MNEHKVMSLTAKTFTSYIVYTYAQVFKALNKL